MILRIMLLCAGLAVTRAAPQYQIGLDAATIASVRANLLSSANASWELGTAVQALLELDYPDFSVFNQSAYPPRQVLNVSDPIYPTDAFALIDKVIADKPGDQEPLIPDGAVGDPASLGIGVLLRNWTRTNLSDTVYSFYAGEQADYVINKAPHTADGACSQRTDQVQLWADFVAMAPPFLAYFGATLGGPNGLWLMQYAYKQCALYRQYLRTPSVSLWQHVVLGNWQDYTHWATGNGWAASGMMRTLQALQRSPDANQVQSEAKNLILWIKEILDGTWPMQQSNGTLLNVLDGNTTSSFVDTSATAMLAATTFRYAVLTNDTGNVDAAVRAMLAVGASIDGNGWLRDTTNPYTFNSPLLNSSTEPGSPEGQAFVLQMHAAWRDYLAAGGKYNSTSSTTTAAPSSSSVVIAQPGSSAGAPLTSRTAFFALACMLTLLSIY